MCYTRHKTCNCHLAALLDRLADRDEACGLQVARWRRMCQSRWQTWLERQGNFEETHDWTKPAPREHGGDTAKTFDQVCEKEDVSIPIQALS